MFKIGDFSKLSRVSVKTLRFYDKLGLLKPAYVDEYNSYRFYSAEQLLTVKRINSFKEQGFTLEQITSFLKEDISQENVRDRLLAKQKELQRTIHEARRQLNEIDARLDILDQADDIPAEFPVTIRAAAPILVASIREVIPLTHLCLLLDEVIQHVRQNGEDESLPLTILWHDFNVEEKEADIEVALPLSKVIPGSGRVKIDFLPELKMAASLQYHCDPYEISFPALTKIASWMTSNGYRLSGQEPVREIYLTSDKDIYGNLRQAELLVPIEPVS